MNNVNDNDSKNTINQKTGFFTVIGETNVGKSTLVNALIGTKVSIVTHKVQTTQSKVLGITTLGNTQIILIDTPGLFSSKTDQGSILLDNTWNEIYEAENIILVLDASARDHERQMQVLKKLNIEKLILVLNKIDKVSKEILLKLADSFSKKFGIREIFMVSALKNHGVEDLKSFLMKRCVDEEWSFDKDNVTDTPFAIFVSEITREKIYEYVHEEVPYLCDVVTHKIDKKKIYQTIYVQRPTHKAILIGKNGNKIKMIGIESRMEISKIFGKEYSLFLNVELMIKQ